MFPIEKRFLEKFNIQGNKYYEKILNITSKNLNTIIEQAQKYLDNYQNGIKVSYGTNIYRIYLTINGIESDYEVAATI